MNLRIVINQLGLLLLTFSACLALTAVWAVSRWALGEQGELEREAWIALVSSALLGVIAGGLCWSLTRAHHTHLGRREGLLLVALSWVVGGLLAALPYCIWARGHFASPAEHPFGDFVNCFFEATSGLTTAGSSVLTDIEAIPESLLLWRSMTHWIGGIGIVVLFVAVLPVLGAGGKKIFHYEASGVTDEGVLPTIRDTARILLLIYCVMTIVMMIILRLCGMTWFDAFCHTAGALATGGFSTKSTSIGFYDSLPIELFLTLFMILGGVNFALFYQAARGRWRQAIADRELRVYLALVFGGSLLVALLIQGQAIITSTGERVGSSFWNALRYALFNVTSVQTTTGYATADYDQWPNLARAIMFALIFIGASAGSTGGGIKVVRIIIAAKVLLNQVERAFRPSVIRPVKVGRSALDADTQLATLGFVLGTILLLSVATAIIMAVEPRDQVDLTTAASASLATFCTTGPGFSKVGPVMNYGWMTDTSKLILCGTMLLGRLEIMALVCLLSPRFWRGD